MPKSDEFSKHEVLHTSMIMAENFAQYILDHHAVQRDVELLAKAQNISNKMFEFYQDCGRKFL